jgi:hypothetical protein
VSRKGFLQHLGIPHHEYWSWWLLVIPVWPLWIYYAIKLRCATWFTVVNPGMEDSGFLGESKLAILKSIPAIYLPTTLAISHEMEFSRIAVLQNNKGIPFPFIAKPDVGGRGRKVEIVKTEEEWRMYHASMTEEYMIQELIPFDVELGVFYTRLPNEEHGKLTSIAQKEFLTVIGDGKSSIQDLMQESYRASMQIERLGKQIDLLRIPHLHEKVVLEPIGNHIRGTSFLSANHIINDNLHQVWDTIAKQIPGFYYGRFDIRVRSLDDLYQGKSIYILELNGLTSDVAHIFDPSFKLRDAYKEQWRHCKISYQIAKQNLRAGAKPTPLFTLLRKTVGYFKYA